MSAIYQRARPIRWDEVVGQEHVKDVLRAALEQGRVGHAYLFSGPRGVGKTTTARLIAMTANCTGPLPKPCGECESCLAVRAGSHPDVLEIDAASNNSVDDVRDLREKVGLAAMRGGKKIYILDEAHMMSRAAFNALLKTLEEPPAHVIFILATTEPEKIIPTILSRCQHYRFRRLSPEEIAGKLAGIVAREGVRAEPDALHLIGRLADGAMRDGESLLERMLAAGTGITRAGVEEALGLPPGERVQSIAASLVLGEAGAAIQGAAALYREGFAARTVVEGLVAALADALHAELGLEGERLEGADVPRLLKLQAALDEQEARFARSADGLSLELALTHALLAVDGGGSGGPIVTPRVASIPSDMMQRLSRLEKEVASLRTGGVRPSPIPADTASSPEVSVSQQAVSSLVAAQDSAPEVIPAELDISWDQVLKAMSKHGGQQIRAFVKEGRHEVRGDTLYLIFDKLDKAGKPLNKFHGDSAIRNAETIGKVVETAFGGIGVVIDSYGEQKTIASKGANKPARSSMSSSGGSAKLAPPQAPAQPPRSADPGPELPAFEPTPRPRASRGPDLAPLDRPTSPQAQVQPQPSRTPPRASAATLDSPAPLRPAPPPSPDDVAPAPLPKASPAPWDEEHAADPPPAPADAQAGDRVPPPEARADLYIVEAVTEEPDWGEIGGEVEGPPPSLDDAPFAGVVPGRPAPRPAPRQTQAAVPTASARPGDIRAHPMYEEIKGRFAGRVREIGKNRNPHPASSAGGDEADEGEA